MTVQRRVCVLPSPDAVLHLSMAKQDAVLH